MAQGAALAYLVAVGGGGADGAPCSLEGCEALVEAGMVVVLMRVAATKSPASPEQIGEKSVGRALMCRCRGRNIVEMRLCSTCQQVNPPPMGLRLLFGFLFSDRPDNLDYSLDRP